MDHYTDFYKSELLRIGYDSEIAMESNEAEGVVVAWDRKLFKLLSYEVIRYDVLAEQYFDFESPGNVALICNLLHIKEKRDMVAVSTHLDNRD